VSLGDGVPFEQGREKGVTFLKIRYFAAIGLYKRLQIRTNLLHVITSTGNGLFIGVNIDDFQ